MAHKIEPRLRLLRLRVGDAHVGYAVGGARFFRLALIAHDIRERAGLVEQQFAAIQTHERLAFGNVIARAHKNLINISVERRGQILSLVAA